MEMLKKVGRGMEREWSTTEGESLGTWPSMIVFLNRLTMLKQRQNIFLSSSSSELGS